MFGKVKLNVKLNRHLSSVEDYDELQNIMGSYSFCKSKHSGKIFLIVTKFKKTTIFYIGNALIVPIWIGLFMLIPISKWICLLLGCVIAFISIWGMSIHRKKFIKKLQFHPLMVLDPHKQVISFYRFKDVTFFQMSEKIKEFKFNDIIKTQCIYTYRIMHPGGGDATCGLEVCVFSLFSRDLDGNLVQNMIFASCDGGWLCEKIATMLNEHAGIPCEVQKGSGLDVYRK